mgnify:CR=1 FL=1
MSGNSFVADTNAILYLLNGNPCMKEYLKTQLFVSIITEMELLGYSQLSDNDKNVLEKFLSCCSIENISIEIKCKTIELRKKYNIKLPDAIIASTAIVKNLPLLSADNVFSKIPEVNFIHLQP